MASQIVVIGAGVIGLSCALELQEQQQQQQSGCGVTILARDFPTTAALIDPRAQIDYTSPWGGAHNRWVPPTTPVEARDHALARATFGRMKALAGASASAGVSLVKGIEYLEKPGPEYLALLERGGHDDDDGLEGFRVLERAELPDERVQLGFEYDTWCVNPMVYCAFLLNRFVLRGGRVVRRAVGDPREVFGMLSSDLGGGAPVAAVVNASGRGFGDGRVFVTRGQTCLVANACAATVTRQNADGSWTFCVPRGFDGGTVIGGTKEPDNWDPEPALAVRERLCRDLVATYPSIAGGGDSGSLRVLQDIVGRRPTRRGGARIEAEVVGPGRTVIHAYGLGGRGFELSWGVAETVARLAAEAGLTRARI